MSLQLARILHRRAHIHGPLALMYHSIPAAKDDQTWPWSLPIQQFRRHLAFLHDEGWTTVTLSRLLTQTPLPEKTVAITFDDGYTDNLDAVDALSAHGMVATWFVVAGCLGQKASWQDIGMPNLSLLSPDQLRDMHARGMEIGSHSVSHVRLPELADDALRRELTESKARLEDVLGTPITSLAYPYGHFDDRVVQAARDAGYTRACTTQSGWALLDNDPLRVRRLTLYNEDNTAVLARKMAYAANDVTWPDVARAYLSRIRDRFARP